MVNRRLHWDRKGQWITQNIKMRKDAYINHHKKNEDWTKPGVKTAGWMSKHILWNKPTLQASVADINKNLKSLKVKMN